jgi:hypothetical protein
MAPVTSIIYFLIEIIYLFDNFWRENIAPIFRVRMMRSLPAGARNRAMRKVVRLF